MELTVSNRTVVRIVAIVAAIVLGIQLVGTLKTQLIWILTAMFLALALEPAVDSLSRRLPRRSRGLAVLAVLLLMVALVSFVLVALIPPFASQLYHLVTTLPTAYTDFLKGNPRLAGMVNGYLNSSEATQALRQFSEQVLSFGGSAVGIIGGIFGGILAVVTILLMTFFMVLEGPRWLALFWQHHPADKRDRRKKLLQQMHRTITGYVNGNLTTSLIASVAAIAMLLILHAPYAFALGLLVGLLDLIPMIGASLAAVLVCLLVLVFQGPTPSFIMAAFFVIYQQVENNILQPVIFSRTVQVSPLITIIALIIGGALAGFLGALVAIPVAASIQLLVRYHFERATTPR